MYNESTLCFPLALQDHVLTRLKLNDDPSQKLSKMFGTRKLASTCNEHPKIKTYMERKTEFTQVCSEHGFQVLVKTPK